jgi:hypothetical protein
MTAEQAAAYINAQAATATITAQAMVAANEASRMKDAAPAYTEDHFIALIEQYGIHHNQVVGFFQQWS